MLFEEINENRENNKMNNPTQLYVYIINIRDKTKAFIQNNQIEFESNNIFNGYCQKDFCMIC